MVKGGKHTISDRKQWVLVVDDVSGLRGNAQRMLEKSGYRVYAAGSCQEAVECYKTARDCGYPFDAVVMPADGVETEGGEDAIRNLHALDPDVRVIIAGGMAERTTANSIAYGFKVALAKTFTGEELVRVLRLQLNFGAEIA